jgi:hypothetical protein
MNLALKNNNGNQNWTWREDFEEQTQVKTNIYAFYVESYGVQIFLSVTKFCHIINFICLSYLVFFYHIKTHLWMIMIKSRIVVVLNMVFMKYLTTLYSLFFMGIKI